MRIRLSSRIWSDTEHDWLVREHGDCDLVSAYVGQVQVSRKRWVKSAWDVKLIDFWGWFDVFLGAKTHQDTARHKSWKGWSWGIQDQAARSTPDALVFRYDRPVLHCICSEWHGAGSLYWQDGPQVLLRPGLIVHHSIYGFVNVQDRKSVV